MTNQEVRLDLQRRSRLGMVEVVWGEDKTVPQITECLQRLNSSGELAIVTRVDSLKARELEGAFDSLEFHSKARCLTVGSPAELKPELGEVALLSGGTSDFEVVAEAELILRWHGIQTKVLLDVGVAGLHRLLEQLEHLKKAKVIIACAGMEGSLPTVLSGLVPQPVIGVPVSIGYGVSSGGRTALESMLASCAPGLVVVNIDNGFGAAMAAIRMLKLNA